MVLFKPCDYVVTYVPNKDFRGYGQIASIISNRYEEQSEIKTYVVGKYLIHYCKNWSTHNYGLEEDYMVAISYETVIVRGLEEGWL